MANPNIKDFAAAGGLALRGRQQSAEHIAARVESTKRALAARVRQCALCGEAFSPTSGAQRYCTAFCWSKVQRARRPASPSRGHLSTKEARLAFESLVATHGNKCALCSREGGANGNGRGNGRLAVDHCHETGVVRGLLCNRCNTALGLFKDDLEILRRAIEYLAPN